MSDKKITYNIDGWANVLSGMGMRNSDKKKYTRYNPQARLSRNELTAMYRGDGFAKKIIDVYSGEMTRQWFKVEGDPDGVILSHLEDLDTKSKFTNLIRWSRLYGGAVIVMGINDGGNLIDPVDENRIQSIDFLHVFDRWEVTWSVTDLYQDPMVKKYGQPEFYRITPVSTGKMFIVHESRVLKLDGDILPSREMHANEGWGDSVLQSQYEQIKNLGVAYNMTAHIIEDFVQAVMSIDNLTELLDGQADKVLNRLNIIDMTKSTMNTILIDSQESYEKKTSSVGGLDVLIDRFALALASVSGIPYSFLMGESPSGLQSTGQADIRMFYDNIKSEQEDNLQPLLEKLIRYMILARDIPITTDEWTIQFTPLWQMTEREQVDLRKAVAEADAIYLDRGVVDPSEIAISRFGGNKFSFETKIDVEMRNNSVPRGTLDEYQRQLDIVKSKLKKDEAPKQNTDAEIISILKKISED